MAVYVALLRNINVGGHPKLAMADLRKAVENLGYEDVRTYIQTGNIVLTAAQTTPAEIGAALEKLISAEFGVTSTAIVRSASEMASVAGANPFEKVAQSPSHLHVTFLAGTPERDAGELDSARGAGEQFELNGQELYLHCPNGYGRTKLNTGLVEKRLGVRATTRNWNSVTTLAAMSSSLEEQ